jgi:3-hydroxyacyl-[acyl-carrier protein] dehydratase/trans-2-decenoyl-[acyl-carrier protein] isomerase
VRYRELLTATALPKSVLLQLGRERGFADAPPEMGVLPAPPMLMFDRVTAIAHEGARGRLVAEQDIDLDAWFFQCHFRGDPVQPGCLGVDAVWQLLGLYCALRGARGTGRALGCKEVEFFGQIRPHDRVVRYEVEIRRYAESRTRGTGMVIGSARVLVDDQHVYNIRDAKVGTFVGIRYDDYPHPSEHSRGGVMEASDD